MPGIGPDGADIGGSCDARFAAVREALRENLAERDELGAAVAVVLEGRPVVDLWCGWTDAARTRPWREDTIVSAFSVGKPLAGLCLLMLVSRGLVDLDEAVASRWPAFAQAGKEGITVRQVLSHQAALPAISQQLPEGALYEWELVTGALERQAPWWAPGEGHGYHVHTFGYLVGEVVRRACGEPVDSFLHREIAQPLGAQVSFGLEPPLRGRRADYVFEQATAAQAEALMRSGAVSELRARAYLNPPGAMGVGTVNTAAWQDAVIPSANLHAEARGVARVYAALAQHDCPLLDAGVLAEARSEACAGTDLVLERPSRFGLGFQLTQPERPMGTNEGSFGHFGAGGSVAFADPHAGLAFAYLMNRGGPQWQDPRNRALIDATYEALAR
ncbi:MAG TPA: serine hydrolase domain-containing protein [Gemmatimonadales bacterium]|nr:serine hydrolase domain-containing protein [Gemmatimonadales bacterium]